MKKSECREPSCPGSRCQFIAGGAYALRVFVTVLTLATSSAWAASVEQGQPMGNPVRPDRVTLPELQTAGCITVGILGATGAYIYGNAVFVTAMGATANPLLGIPFVVSGFGVGCGVGALVTPGLLHVLFGY